MVVRKKSGGIKDGRGLEKIESLNLVRSASRQFHAFLIRKRICYRLWYQRRSPSVVLAAPGVVLDMKQGLVRAHSTLGGVVVVENRVSQATPAATLSRQDARYSQMRQSHQNLSLPHGLGHRQLWPLR